MSLMMNQLMMMLMLMLMLLLIGMRMMKQLRMSYLGSSLLFVVVLGGLSLL
jgi:hypothetical protein